MATYTVSLTCKRNDAVEILTQAKSVFGNVRMYVVDPLLSGLRYGLNGDDLTDERQVTFDYAAQQGDTEDPFDGNDAQYVDETKLAEMIQKVRENAPAITAQHVIYR